MKPRMFVGSSSEAWKSGGVDQLIDLLRSKVKPALWTENLFKPGDVTVDSLRAKIDECQFALVFLSDDDVAVIRKKTYSVPRDNAIFELGMAMASMGRQRAFFVSPRSAADLHLPSDIEGITSIRYDGVLKKDMIAPSAEILDKVKSLKGSLDGKWIQSWSVDSTSFPKVNASEATVAHYGSDFRAKFESEGIVYQARGTVAGKHVTGVWRDRDHPERYTGSFQLFTNGVGTSLRGRWCGFTNTNLVQSNSWEWDRP